MFPIIILSYLPSVEVNIILKVTDFSDIIYTFYLPSFIRHSGNHTGREYTSLKSSQKNYGLLLVKISNRRSFSLDQNLPECCISRVIFEFRILQQCYLIPLRSNISKTGASVSPGVPNTEKVMKARGRRRVLLLFRGVWNP